MTTAIIEGVRPALVNVKKFPRAGDVMWRLLEERDPKVNISHGAMPTPEAHAEFMAAPPYRVWYVIAGFQPGARLKDALKEPETIRAIGSIYLTPRNEIGVFVLREHQGKGFGRWAVNALMRMWGPSLTVPRTHAHLGKEFYANVNPENDASLGFFEKLGFNVRQLTLARKADEPIAPEPEVESESLE